VISGFLILQTHFSDLGSVLDKWEMSFKSASKDPRHATSQDEFLQFESLVKTSLSNAVSLLCHLYSPSDQDIYSSMAPKLSEKLCRMIRVGYDGPLEKC